MLKQSYFENGFGLGKKVTGVEQTGLDTGAEMRGVNT